MSSVLASSVVDRGFELRQGQTKDYKSWYQLPFRLAHSIKEKEQTTFGIRIMCSSGVTCLFADGCFSHLALCKINLACRSITNRSSSSSYSLHDIAEKLLSWRYTTITHSLNCYNNTTDICFHIYKSYFLIKTKQRSNIVRMAPFCSNLHQLHSMPKYLRAKYFK